MKLIEHNIRLAGKKVRLRPMTESDWDVLYAWNNNPEILFFAENDDVVSIGMDKVQEIYRVVSQNAFCFIMVSGGMRIGECWLQNMNLERIKVKYPERDCRRIDLMIGETQFWGRGIGTEVIGLLTGFGIRAESAEYIFGCDIAEDNRRSLKAFYNNGYTLESRIQQPPGSKFRYCCDVVISREKYLRHNRGTAGP